MTEETKQTIMSFGQLYGPYAFGVASLLLIWFTIVKPELNQRNFDFKAQMEVLQSLNERDVAQKEIANSMAATSAVLERIVTRLENANR